MTVFVLAAVTLFVVTAIASGLVYALIRLATRARARLAGRHPPLKAPPLLPLDNENPLWTALDDRQLGRYLKDSPE